MSLVFLTLILVFSLTNEKAYVNILVNFIMMTLN